MNNEVRRAQSRQFDQLRDIKISYNVFGYAPGSVLFELGNTKVLCSVSMQIGVPPFLKGTKTGWLTAEYAMLPTSGQTRSIRESTQAKRNDRSVEISRLIGRSLRAIVNLSLLGERTIHIDCDVLQADGSTRTASISGSYIALRMAVDHWLKNGELIDDIVIDAVAAVSAGFSNGQPLLDLDYAEDSIIDADYNFVFTQSEKIVEIQGAAEKNALSWNDFDKLKAIAIQGNKKIFQIIEGSLALQNDARLPMRASKDQNERASVVSLSHSKAKSSSDAPLFSLKNRLKNAL